MSKKTKQVQPAGASYVEQQRKDYALYILQHRAIPAITDGLKTAARRVLWVAQDNHKYKSATLAGGVMHLHPHDAPTTTINTLAAYYGNNAPLLKGYGAFGTRLKPTSYGAARYTSVKASQFANDVLYKDIEIIPMVDNYDQTTTEPLHFLPLVPVVLVNPSQGAAIGYASTILPRSLEQIIENQIKHLQGKKKLTEPYPTVEPLNSTATEKTIDAKGNPRWTFEGSFVHESSTKVRVTDIPYGYSHDKYVEKLIKLIDQKQIEDFIDNSKKTIDITVKFKRSVLMGKDDEQLIKLLNLRNTVTENLNVLNFDGETILSTDPLDIIRQFTDWRLKWYQTRYQRLHDLLDVDIQKLRDLITAIDNDVGSVARNMAGKSELIEHLDALGIVNKEYIANIPVYRFTQDEKDKTEKKLQEALETKNYYQTLLNDEEERKKVYITELREIAKKARKGTYNANQ